MAKENGTMKKQLIFLFFLSTALSLFTAYNQHMNNFLIFRASFFHLWDGVSLYQLYPSEHHDLFKYSPTFAMLMGLFAWLPKELGGTLWNLLGVILFSMALISYR